MAFSLYMQFVWNFPQKPPQLIPACRFEQDSTAGD